MSFFDKSAAHMFSDTEKHLEFILRSFKRMLLDNALCVLNDDFVMRRNADVCSAREQQVKTLCKVLADLVASFECDLFGFDIDTFAQANIREASISQMLNIVFGSAKVGL